MENMYNDELLPENFETIAKAYSASLKNKGFVFVRLQEEEFNLLIGEIFVILSKMLACLSTLDRIFDSTCLKNEIKKSSDLISQKFCIKKAHSFKCAENENNAFLSLISLENLLTIKLMILSVKSGEFELCNQIITNICSIFAESFSTEGFILKD